jgi:hypothetical protein
MRTASRTRTAAAALVLAAAWGAGAAPAAAEDVANGLWQDYRYPTDNPNWRAVYYDNVRTWGWDPVDLRVPYHSSPDVLWNVYVPPANPYWNGPYYTTSHWEPYVPRPIDWSGLEYSLPSAPPVGNTGYHAWYGFSSPGPRSFTPEEWVEWEQHTPQGREYLAKSGARVAAPPPAEERLPVLPRRGLKQYDRPKAGERRWREHEKPVPPEPAALPTRAVPEHRGFIQYYRQTGQRGWQSREVQVKAPRPAPSRGRPVAGPAVHRGFTQYYLKSTPGPGQGKWQTKSGRVFPNQ